MELNKRTVTAESLGPFLLRYAAGEYQIDEHGESDQQLKILNAALVAAPGEVYGVSYDYLKEKRLSLASFLFCNVTLAGKNWAECQALVDGHKVDGFENKSPQPATIDLVRLAKNLQSQRGCSLNLTAADQTTGTEGSDEHILAEASPTRTSSRSPKSYHSAVASWKAISSRPRRNGSGGPKRPGHPGH